MTLLTQGILLSPDHWAQMKADVSARQQEEACGLIAGVGNRCYMVVPVTNILHSPYKFRMEPQEELNAFYLAEERGWDILAVYHSHPHGISTPSPTDFAELTFPGVIYLIWYKAEDDWSCRGFLMNSQDESVEVPVVIMTGK